MFFIREHRWLLLLVLFGGAIRLIGLDALPAGLNQDEASAGYDAYALLTYGMDRNGYPYPVHLVAWGSGQNALYSYLAIPFIALLDLSVFSFRLPAALLGCLSILLIYWFLRAFTSSVGALIGTFLVAISPWHLMMSRWGLEANIFPTIVLAAIVCLLYSKRWTAALYGFAVLMALSLYAYGTAYLFVPLMMLGIAVFLLCYRQVSLKQLVLAYFTFVVIAIPLCLFLLVNLYEWEPMVSSVGSIPRYTGSNRFTEITVLSSGEKFAGMVEHLKQALEILTVRFHDGNAYNSIEGYGYLYYGSLPLILIGLGVAAATWWKQKNSLPHYVLLLWFLCALTVCASLSVNFNRMNIVFYPLIIFAAIGVEVLYKQLKSTVPIAMVMGMFVISAGFFLHYYFGEYKENIGESFYESFEDAIKTVDRTSPANEPVYVTGNINMPYIAVLFHTRYDVRDYLATRQIPHMNTMFQSVTAFGRYTFGDPRPAAHVGHSFVVHNHELPAFPESRFIIRHFKFYSAVFSRERYQEAGDEIRWRDGVGMR